MNKSNKSNQIKFPLAKKDIKHNNFAMVNLHF